MKATNGHTPGKYDLAVLDRTSQTLSKRIFAAEVPEEYIRTLPAQTLSLAVRRAGLGSSADLIEIAGLEQCRLMIDFDCWTGDTLAEDNLWEWLALPDALDDLKILRKFVNFVDLKLLAYLFDRYINVEVFEEPTDLPPGPEHFSPDKGRTWIRITAPDSTKQFYLGRLLAMLFETDPQVFYQLLSVPSVATRSMLIEDAFQEREKRLLAEGVPDRDLAWEICSPAAPDAVRKLLAEGGDARNIEIACVEPLIFDSANVQPLGALMQRLALDDEALAELTLIMNAAIVRWNVEFHDYEAVQKLSSKVKGCINIGLLAVAEFDKRPLEDAFGILSFQNLFRFGLWHALELRRDACALPRELLEKLSKNQPAFAVVAGLREDFPEVPDFIDLHGKQTPTEEGKLKIEYKALETLEQINELRAFLAEVA